jgi:GDP-L-fucose synthase
MSGKLLITGGSGLLGNSFKKILPDALYPKRDGVDLLDRREVFTYIKHMKPDTVIHLAGKVGGVKANTDNMYDFFSENLLMNSNIIDACVTYKIPKLVCCLSTCIYPDEKFINYPLTEQQLHLGEPHHSNFGYAYAKRMVDVHLRAVRQQYDLKYISVVPNNIYGEHDNFDLTNGHVIPAMIRKIWEAKINGKPSFEVWGDGEIFREFTYADDIRDAILFCNEHYTSQMPINIGNSQEYSLKQIIELICKFLDYQGDIIFDKTKPKGQIRKPSSNQKFIESGWREENYTSIEVGLKKTCEWFMINYPNIRGIK